MRLIARTATAVALLVPALIGLASGPQAAAASTANIPGLPLPAPVTTGRLGGPVYDVVFAVSVPAGSRAARVADGLCRHGFRPVPLRFHGDGHLRGSAARPRGQFRRPHEHGVHHVPHHDGGRVLRRPQRRHERRGDVPAGRRDRAGHDAATVQPRARRRRAGDQRPRGGRHPGRDGRPVRSRGDAVQRRRLDLASVAAIRDDDIVDVRPARRAQAAVGTRAGWGRQRVICGPRNHRLRHHAARGDRARTRPARPDHGHAAHDLGDIL